MNIVIYNTNTTSFDSDFFCISSYPSLTSQWEKIASQHPQHRFIFVSALPGMFLLDYSHNQLKEQAENITYYILHSRENFQEITQIILSYQPDLVLSASYWIQPFDWLPLQDALVAELLKKKGIQTVCHDSKTVLTCFNKSKTHNFLISQGLPAPKQVYIHHELYVSHKNRREILHNPYREFIFSQLETLQYPVVVKDTVGFSSYGTEVLQNAHQVKTYLDSKRNNFDRVVEEYIPGIQIGVEIHGEPGNYVVFPPFLFSVNKYGITSPKLGCKFGPLTEKDVNLTDLYELIIKVSKTLQFKGSAQIDLIYSQSQWYILEINPRLSGMTSTCAAALSLSVAEYIFDQITNAKAKHIADYQSVLNIKIPLQEEKNLEKLRKLPEIYAIEQIENKKAKQQRERGYCQVIFCLEKENSSNTSSKEKLNLLQEKLSVLQPYMSAEDFVQLENTISEMSSFLTI
ncbi:MAG: ATP-grasp domain-containing protein [Candidatus Treponema excrementipullorum]|nr:ATP-grasp domain-containing protein [Candidatus Treponema excrementipullorum]